MIADLPVRRTEIPGPRSRALAGELRRWESANVTFIDPEGRFPVFWESAHDCLVTDVDGNTFLDLTAAFGVAAVGHTNPRVTAAIAAQSAKLIHGMGDVHPPAIKVELAHRRKRLWREESKKEYTGDALALRGDEGRDKLR